MEFWEVLQRQGVVHEAVATGKCEGWTPLIIAAKQAHLSVVQYLMEVGCLSVCTFGETLW